jgi:hypothetical protein
MTAREIALQKGFRELQQAHPLYRPLPLLQDAELSNKGKAEGKDKGTGGLTLQAV